MYSQPAARSEAHLVNTSMYTVPALPVSLSQYGNAGGLTATTPTLTPTTLKSIQDLSQSFLEREGTIPATMDLHHPHQAGFAPPVVHIGATQSLATSNHHHHLQHFEARGNHNQAPSLSDGDDSMNSDDSSSQPSTWVTNEGEPMESGSTSQSNDSQMGPTSFSGFGGAKRNKKTPRTRGNTGRRPNNSEKLSPEEESRRNVRRERNKLAAARCRKRRMDHTNELTKQTEGLESERANLQNELHALQKQKEDLEYVLQSHKSGCKLMKQTDAKSLTYGHNGNGSISSQQKTTSRPRPNSLQLSTMTLYQASQPSSHPSIAVSNSESLVPIQTPSAGLFALDGLMEGGTGLTPLLATPQGGFVSSASSSCGGQQRSNGEMVTSPENGPPKLVSL